MPLSDQRIKWGAIVYRWRAEDMDLRVSFARSIMPRDFFTLLALWIVRPVTAVLAFVLKPFDAIARLIGRLLTAVVVGLFVLMVLDGLWILIWGLLVGTSWLWFRSGWYRPILFIPGVALAVLALVFIKLAPDPHKEPSYIAMATEWPLTFKLWQPPVEYFESTEPA